MTECFVEHEIVCDCSQAQWCDWVMTVILSAFCRFVVHGVILFRVIVISGKGKKEKLFGKNLGCSWLQ